VKKLNQNILVNISRIDTDQKECVNKEILKFEIIDIDEWKNFSLFLV
jgi:hypothetical protein